MIQSGIQICVRRTSKVPSMICPPGLVERAGPDYTRAREKSQIYFRFFCPRSFVDNLSSSVGKSGLANRTLPILPAGPLSL